MPISNDIELTRLLSGIRHIALVGASDRPERPSHGVMAFLMSQGYRVTPVNPLLAGERILGQTVVASLAEVDTPIDMVDIFRNSEAAAGVVEEAVAVGAGGVWMQLGVINPAAAARAEQAGLWVVVNRCPAIDIPRLGLLA